MSTSFRRLTLALALPAFVPLACSDDPEPVSPPLLPGTGGSGAGAGSTTTTGMGFLCPTGPPAGPMCEAPEATLCEYNVDNCLVHYTCVGGTWQQETITCAEPTCDGAPTFDASFIARFVGPEARASALAVEPATALVATRAAGMLELDGAPLHAGPGPALILTRHAGSATPTTIVAVAGNLVPQAMHAQTEAFVGGTVAGAVTWGTNDVTIAGSDFFVGELSSALEPGWFVTFGSPQVDEADIDLAPLTGGVAVAATVKPEALLEGAPLTQGGMRDGLLARIDGGVVQWSRTFASGGNDAAVAVATGPSDLIAVVGFADGTVDFGAGPVVTAGNELFVSVYDADGALQWVQHCATSSAWDTDVVIDDGGFVHVAGWSAAPIDCGGEETIAGTNAHFLLSFDGSGALTGTVTGSPGGLQGAWLDHDPLRGIAWATVDADLVTGREILTVVQIDAAGAEVDRTSLEVAGTISLEGVAWTADGVVVNGRWDGSLCTDSEPDVSGAGFVIALPLGG